MYKLSFLATIIFIPFFLFAQTHLVLLGTGTPFADPERSGPSLAIVVNEQAYIVDCGPGVVRRAAQASAQFTALKVANLNKLFITHLHTDHTVGYSDMIFTPAVLDRPNALSVWGPKGLKKMTNHILNAYKEDMDVRINGLEMGNKEGYKVLVQEISKGGYIYEDSNVKVKAFMVHHGSWDYALGYRFETKDKVIVVSGDCTYSEALIENAKDCDILVHEVYSEEGLNKREDRWKKYHSTFHTSSTQVATIANLVRPKLLVLNHQLLFGASKESLLQEIKRTYTGPLVYGNDLDVF